MGSSLRGSEPRDLSKYIFPFLDVGSAKGTGKAEGLAPGRVDLVQAELSDIWVFNLYLF